jgi:dipeptidyl aminopeptidase/acylaminoacyl peptidase
MRQFTITQLLMVTWLVAIVTGFVTWGGCDRAHRKVSGVAFSPDGKHLVVVENSARAVNEDFHNYYADCSRTISVLAPSTGRTERIIERAMRRGITGTGRRLYRDVQNTVAFGPKGNVLLVQEYGEAAIKNYDFGSRQWQRRKEDFTEHQWLSFAVTPDGRHGAVTTFAGVVIAWDVAAGRASAPVNTLPGDMSSGPPSVAISSDGSLIAVASESAAELRRGAEGALIASLTGVPGGFSAQTVAFSPDGKLLAVGGGALVLYDLKTLQPRRMQENEIVTALAFSPDGNTLAVSRGTLTVVCDVASGRDICDLECAGRVTALAYSPDGSRLAEVRQCWVIRRESCHSWPPRGSGVS